MATTSGASARTASTARGMTLETGSRVRKQAFARSGNAWSSTPALDLKFDYDGWNLLMETDTLQSDHPVRIYSWGLDLSGSMHGAGSIRGPLGVQHLDPPTA